MIQGWEDVAAIIAVIISCFVPFLIMGRPGPDIDGYGRRYYFRNGRLDVMYPFPKPKGAK
jgi:hypothetical protein